VSSIVVCEECGQPAEADLSVDRWRCSTHGLLSSWEVFDHRGLYQYTGSLDDVGDELSDEHLDLNEVSLQAEVARLRSIGTTWKAIRARLAIGTKRLSKVANGTYTLQGES
jgi:hypothetical protein